jgi:hypothetical protein
MLSDKETCIRYASGVLIRPSIHSERDDFMNLRSLFTLGLLASTIGLLALPAAAQMSNGPSYRQWQPSWDQGRADARHVILGTVTQFQPFRLQIARTNGTVQTIDLKHGTAILPTGEKPAANQRVAVVGYYSQGTFIANRVILRD